MEVFSQFRDKEFYIHCDCKAAHQSHSSPVTTHQQPIRSDSPPFMATNAVRDGSDMLLWIILYVAYRAFYWKSDYTIVCRTLLSIIWKIKKSIIIFKPMNTVAVNKTCYKHFGEVFSPQLITTSVVFCFADFSNVICILQSLVHLMVQTRMPCLAYEVRCDKFEDIYCSSLLVMWVKSARCLSRQQYPPSFW